jgi:hypothetical protein
MANATPVHSGSKKPLSKEAQRVKKELAELEANKTNAGDNVDLPAVPPTKRKLADGTIREDK